MNAPRPLMNSGDMQIRSGGFRRIASGGSFTVSTVSTGLYADVFPPCKIIDLDARTEGDIIMLTWTAPGDDFDQGRGRFSVNSCTTFSIVFLLVFIEPASNILLFAFMSVV